jgi:Domain of unknown function (DUF4167)
MEIYHSLQLFALNQRKHLECARQVSRVKGWRFCTAARARKKTEKEGNMMRRSRGGSRNGGSHTGSNGGGGRRPSNGVPSRNQIFDSNGPDIRIRGTAWQVYEKYLALARDSQAAGDRVTAENYLQHGEHYYRIILAITEAMGEAYAQRPAGGEGDTAEVPTENETEGEAEVVSNEQPSDDGLAANIRHAVPAA